MKPAAFEYLRPDTLAEALELRAQHGDDVLTLAGGQSLIPTMNFRLAQPAALIDLGRVKELSGHALAESGALRLGAMVRQRFLERSPVVVSHAPLLSEATPYVAHPQIRNRGTVGGTLAQADPTGEIPAVLLASGARVKASSIEGERWIPLEDFFLGWFENALGPAELVTEVEVPSAPSGQRVAFEEIARRRGDHALAGVGVAVCSNEAGLCTQARIGVLGAGDRPLRAQSAESLLEGEAPSSGLIAAAIEAMSENDVDPLSDGHASSGYRRALLEVVTRKALHRAFGLGDPTR